MDSSGMADLVFSEFGRFFTQFGMIVAIPIGVGAVALVVAVVVNAIRPR